DLSLTVKANHYEIELISPSETLRLPAELDETEKQLRQAQADLLEYQSREPVLDLQFDSREKYVRFRLTRPSDAAGDPEPEIQSLLKAAKEKVTLVALEPKQEPGATTIANNRFAEIAESIQKITGGGRQFY